MEKEVARTEKSPSEQMTGNVLARAMNRSKAAVLKVWSAFGLGAGKSGTPSPPEKKAAYQAKRARQRPRVNAYINPWHKI